MFRVRSFLKCLSGVVALAVVVAFHGCGDDGDQNCGSHIASISSLVRIVPSSGLPREVTPQQANNNLDIVQHQGRVFLAFRTAPSHFASAEAVLYVLSSRDEKQWTFETMVSVGTDVREPRFLSWNGELFLYFAVLGANPLDFEPKGMMGTCRRGSGQWTEPIWVYQPGFIPWRTKTLHGIPYMVAYVGGEGLYDPIRKPLEIHWLTTSDGWNWIPVVPGRPVVQRGGGSETDFVFQDDGSLVAVTRNEGGDEYGWGSKICRAEPDEPGAWECIGDPRKYDSPLLFRHGSGTYLLGRRNVTETGNYDLGRDDLPPFVQGLLYELDYWLHPKRCSLWQVDPYSLKVSFILDLPSCGDTCFPGLARIGDREYLVYNYSSPLDNLNINWVTGQLGPTSISRMILTFRE